MLCLSRSQNIASYMKHLCKLTLFFSIRDNRFRILPHPPPRSVSSNLLHCTTGFPGVLLVRRVRGKFIRMTGVVILHLVFIYFCSLMFDFI